VTPIRQRKSVGLRPTDSRGRLSPHLVLRWSIYAFLFFLSLSPHVFAIEPPSPPAYGVRIEQAWIPMKDGVRLAATLYMPEGAKPGEQFPALLEYLPDLVRAKAHHQSGNIPCKNKRMESR